MLVALNTEQERCLARDTSRNEGPFTCPECQRTVILKKGKVKTHHYAHTPPAVCSYGVGESERHQRAKYALYDAISTRPDVIDCVLEKRLPGVRPDVYFIRHGKPVAIEVQRSTIDTDYIDHRMQCYTRLNIPVLWLILADTPDSAFRPKVWQQHLHYLYYGRIYFWQAGSQVQAVHLARSQRWIEYREWYTEGGYHEEAGGYFVPYKAHRAPQGLPDSIDIVEDFRQSQGIILYGNHILFLPPNWRCIHP